MARGRVLDSAWAVDRGEVRGGATSAVIQGIGPVIVLSRDEGLLGGVEVVVEVWQVEMDGVVALAVEVVVAEAAYRARVSNAVKQVANFMLLSLSERGPTCRSMLVVGQLHVLGDPAQSTIVEIVCLQGNK